MKTACNTISLCTLALAEMNAENKQSVDKLVVDCAIQRKNREKERGKYGKRECEREVGRGRGHTNESGAVSI